MPKRSLPARPKLTASRGRAVQGMGGAELNNYDVTYSKIGDVGRAAQHYVANLSTVPMGSGVGQRIGRKVVVRELEYTIVVWATDGYNALLNYHFALVLDKQASGSSLPSPTLLFVDTGGTEDIDGVRNLAYAERFRVLLDRRGWVSSLAGPTRGNDHGLYRIHGRKKLNMPMLFNVAGAAETNQLLFYEGCGANLSGGSPPSSQFSCYAKFRIRYTDN